MIARLWLAAGLVAATLPRPAAALCTWEWLCNGDGQCKQMPVCDSVHDVPPPKPEGVEPPVPPPTAMRPPGLAGSGPGRAANHLTCEYIMRQDRNGRWRWREACFCTDPTKAPDPSAPFAHIVRCDAK